MCMSVFFFSAVKCHRLNQIFSTNHKQLSNHETFPYKLV
jgi:hypothetical protein